MLFFSLSKIMFFVCFLWRICQTPWTRCLAWYHQIDVGRTLWKKITAKTGFFLFYFAQDSAKISARCSRTRKKLICLEISKDKRKAERKKIKRDRKKERETGRKKKRQEERKRDRNKEDRHKERETERKKERQNVKKRNRK